MPPRRILTLWPITAKKDLGFDRQVVDACLEVMNGDRYEFDSQYHESSLIFSGEDQKA